MALAVLIFSEGFGVYEDDFLLLLVICSIWKNKQNFSKIDTYNFNSLPCAAKVRIEFEVDYDFISHKILKLLDQKIVL